MGNQVGKSVETSSSKASQQKASPRLRPIREWKFFRPHFDRYYKMRQWGAETRRMEETEYPQIWKTVGEMSTRAGMDNPVIWIVKDEFPNASAWRNITRDGQRQNHINYTLGYLKNATGKDIRITTAHEIGHLKMKHTRQQRLKEAIRWNRFRAALHLCNVTAVTEMAAMAVAPVSAFLTVPVALSAGLAYLVARTALRNLKRRRRERQAIEFSVEMNGKIMETMLQQVEQKRLFDGFCTSSTPLNTSLSLLLLDGYVYKALNVLLPRTYDVVFQAWNSINNKIVDLMDAYDAGLDPKKAIPRALMPLAMLTHFIFSDHPSWKKEKEIIEKAEHRFMEEHPGWKPPERMGNAL
ncbi:MAG: M48 family metalloprotease [Candidatus Micrarchaeota archaeon]|nr:M48 family metalloprotease [Candidatus Micrarchaeota archaeon]